MKKMLCCLFAMLMLCCLFPYMANAAVSSCVTVGTVNGYAGGTVIVPIEVSDNPGVVALRMHVQYDSAKLQLLDATDNGAFGSGNDYFGHDKTENPYTLMWEDALSKSNYTANGQIAELTFKILESASPGKTDVTITLDAGSTFNVDLQNVAFTTQSGSVQICNNTVSDDQITGVSVQDLTMYYKESGSLRTQVQMTGQAEYKITYQPENEKMIKVDEKGNVTALHWGTTKANVTVTDNHGNTWTDSCAVQVNCHLWQRIIIICLFGWLWY